MIKEQELISEYFNKYYPVKKKYVYNEILGIESLAATDIITGGIAGIAVSLIALIIIALMNRSNVSPVGIDNTYSNGDNYKRYSNNLQKTQSLIESSSLSPDDKKGLSQDLGMIQNFNADIRKIHADRSGMIKDLLGMIQDQTKIFPNYQQSNVNNLIEQLKNSQARTVAVEELKRLRKIVNDSNLQEKKATLEIIDRILDNMDLEKSIWTRMKNSVVGFFTKWRSKGDKNVNPILDETERIINESRIMVPPLDTEGASKKAKEIANQDTIYIEATFVATADKITSIKIDNINKELTEKTNIIIDKEGLTIIDNTTLYFFASSKDDAMEKLIPQRDTKYSTEISFTSDNVIDIKLIGVTLEINAEGLDDSKKETQKIKISYNSSGGRELFYSTTISNKIYEYSIQSLENKDIAFGIKNFTDKEYIKLIKEPNKIFEFEVLAFDFTSNFSDDQIKLLIRKSAYDNIENKHDKNYREIEKLYEKIDEMQKKGLLKNEDVNNLEIAIKKITGGKKYIEKMKDLKYDNLKENNDIFNSKRDELFNMLLETEINIKKIKDLLDEIEIGAKAGIEEIVTEEPPTGDESQNSNDDLDSPEKRQEKLNEIKNRRKGLVDNFLKKIDNKLDNLKSQGLIDSDKKLSYYGQDIKIVDDCNRIIVPQLIELDKQISTLDKQKLKEIFNNLNNELSKAENELRAKEKEIDSIGSTDKDITSDEEKEKLKIYISQKISEQGLKPDDFFISSDQINLKKLVSDNIFTNEQIFELTGIDISKIEIKTEIKTLDDDEDDDQVVDLSDLPDLPNDEEFAETQTLTSDQLIATDDDLDDLDTFFSENSPETKILNSSYNRKSKKSELILNEIFYKEIFSLKNKKTFKYFEEGAGEDFITFEKYRKIIYKMPAVISINDLKKIKYSNVFTINLDDDSGEVKQVDPYLMNRNIKTKNYILFYQTKEQSKTDRYSTHLNIKNMDNIEKYMKIIQTYFNFNTDQLTEYLNQQEPELIDENTKTFRNSFAGTPPEIVILRNDYISPFELQVVKKGMVSSEKIIDRIKQEKDEQKIKSLKDILVKKIKEEKDEQIKSKNTFVNSNKEETNNIPSTEPPTELPKETPLIELPKGTPSPDKELKINIFKFFRNFEISKTEKDDLKFIERSVEDKVLIFNLNAERVKQIYNSEEYRSFKEKILKQSQPQLFQYNESDEINDYKPVKFEIKVSFFTNQDKKKIFKIENASLKQIVQEIDQSVIKKPNDIEAPKESTTTDESTYYFLSLKDIMSDSSKASKIDNEFKEENGIIFKKFTKGDDAYSGNLYVKEIKEITLKELLKLQTYFNIDMQDYILQEAFDIRSYESSFISDNTLAVIIENNQVEVKRKGNIKTEKNKELITQNQELLKSEIDTAMQGIEKTDADYEELYKSEKQTIYKKYGLIDTESETGEKIRKNTSSPALESAGIIYKKAESKRGIPLIKALDKINSVKNNKSLELYYYVKVKDSFYYFKIAKNIIDILNSLIKEKGFTSKPNLTHKIDDLIDIITNDRILLKKSYKSKNEILKKADFKFGRIAKVENIKDKFVFTFPTSETFQPEEVSKSSPKKEPSQIQQPESFNLKKIDSIIINEVFNKWKK